MIFIPNFYVSRNVVFQKPVFPFIHAKSYGSPLFPVLDLSNFESNTFIQSPTLITTESNQPINPPITEPISQLISMSLNLFS